MDLPNITRVSNIAYCPISQEVLVLEHTNIVMGIPGTNMGQFVKFRNKTITFSMYSEKPIQISYRY